MSIASAFSAIPSAPRRLLRGPVSFPPPPPNRRSSLTFLHRSPFLLLATALMVLAVLFAPGGQPAQAATSSFWSATLTPANAGGGSLGCLHIAPGNCSTTSVLSDNDFTYGVASYVIKMIVLNSSGTLYINLDKAIPDALKNSDVALVVGSTSLAFSNATRGNGLGTNDRLTWSSTGLSWITGDTVSLSLTEPITTTAEFGEGVTIPDKTYTAGADVNRTYTGDQDQGLPMLPEVTVEFGVEAGKGQYDVVYTLADLPAGLSMGTDRVIRGVPESATSGAVTVTYTATVTFYTLKDGTEKPNEEFEETGTATASLTFAVTVNLPVTFGAEAQKFFAARTVTFASGAWKNNVLPAAQGGTGTLTYTLIDNDTKQPLASSASITFNAATRTITGSLSQGQRYAVTLIATDENGATAQGYIQVRHAVGGV